MRFPFIPRLFGQAPEIDESLPSAPTDAAAQVIPSLAPALKIASAIHPVAASALSRWKEHQAPRPEPAGHASTFLKTVALVSAGLGALALGLAVGRELRQRYKFTRRTPYDFYAHAGDERDLEFGVGI